jgi:fatty-acyl-CoA synthase
LEQLSHVTGAKHPSLLEIAIGRTLELAAQKWGDNKALVSVHQGVRLIPSAFIAT